jgi:hypothetical protein
MPRLRTTVHVTDENGATRIFEAGQDVPDWAATQITNPDVWEGELPPHLQGEQDPSQPPETPSAPVGAMPPHAQGTPVAAQSETGSGEPPRSGKGSGKEAWAAYADSLGVDVPGDASRDDIVAHLVERGLIEPS